ncbi:hypothetical protein [Salana multivorans]|uniref:hypothetical protein n=1 Tax=Salana multivorans TaxID=120377 RepID=UPI0011CDB082|nr:hypothetical protein [Salana multivorans]
MGPLGASDGAARSGSPLVNRLCERLGVGYGGWEAIAPLLGGEKGAQVTFHVDDGTVLDREPFLPGTGVVREARAYPDRVEVWDGATLVATYDDLSIGDVFGS